MPTNVWLPSLISCKIVRRNKHPAANNKAIKVTSRTLILINAVKVDGEQRKMLLKPKILRSHWMLWLLHPFWHKYWLTCLPEDEGRIAGLVMEGPCWASLVYGGSWPMWGELKYPDTKRVQVRLLPMTTAVLRSSFTIVIYQQIEINWSEGVCQ